MRSWVSRDARLQCARIGGDHTQPGKIVSRTCELAIDPRRAAVQRQTPPDKAARCQGQDHHEGQCTAASIGGRLGLPLVSGRAP